MGAQEILLHVGLILLAGVVSIPLAVLLRLPVMVVLLGAGLLVGPSVLDWVENAVSRQDQG